MTKQERLADCQRRQNIASKKCKRQEKLLEDYLESNMAKQLRRNVQIAIDKVNAIIYEWNDIIMEDYYSRQGR